MRLVPVVYFGFTAMDRRFSSPMLPWIFTEIRKRDHREKLSLGVEDGHLTAYNPDFEVHFTHRLSQMTRFSQAEGDPATFLYLLRADDEQLLYCYLYQASTPHDVTELYEQMTDEQQQQQKEEMRRPPRMRSLSLTPLTAVCGAISPSCSNFFEVLYVGKVRVWHKQVPDTFVDDALVKFRAHDVEKRRAQLTRLRSECDLRSASPPPPLPQQNGGMRGRLQRSHSLVADLASHAAPSIGDSGDHNRTMVLQVDDAHVRLISPDRKQLLLDQQHRDVTTCAPGLQHSDHFGFIAREPMAAAYIGYVFKCESPSVVGEAVAAITHAFNAAAARSACGGGGGSGSGVRHVASVASCDRCPMVWYHRLCCDIERLAERKQLAAIWRRVDQLSVDERALITAKCEGAAPSTLTARDHTEMLMMLLRAHCEMKQAAHAHIVAGASSGGGGGGGSTSSTIFMKAKRSLSVSFDHLLKRRGSRDDCPPPVAPSVGRNSEPPPESPPPASPTSPMLDIFMKLGNNTSSMGMTSWRQAIFKRVRTPPSPSPQSPAAPPTTPPTVTRSGDEWRHLWRTAIRQAVLLVRMERENARMRAALEDVAVRRIKLEYDELRTVVGGGNADEGEAEAEAEFDFDDVAQMRVRGVPRAHRGHVWLRACANTSPPPPTYASLLKQLTSHQHAILIDVGRTFPTHAYYRSPLGAGQLALFNLLKAYSLLDPDVGYCQGLSFVAGVLLLHMDESDAFRLLRHLMFEQRMRAQYLPDMGALQLQLYQMARLVRDRLPDVHAHLDAHDVPPTLYAAPWLLTLFASQFPLGFVARVFDAVFSERHLSTTTTTTADDDVAPSTLVVCRIALALLTRHRRALCACATFEAVMTCMQRTMPTMDAATVDAIFDATAVGDVAYVHPHTLAAYAVEYGVLHEEAHAVQRQHDECVRMRTQRDTLLAYVRHLVATPGNTLTPPDHIVSMLATSTSSSTDSGVTSPSDALIEEDEEEEEDEVVAVVD